MVALIVVAAIVVTQVQSRLAAVLALATVGYGVSLLYIMFGAPDLAMTQFSIETLTVVLFVLVIYRLPRFATLTNRAARLRDALIAASAGVLMTSLVLILTADTSRRHVTTFFSENSVLLAKGRNIVNVILVDFRAFDTLGEIIVLSVAAAGVYALMRLRPERERREALPETRATVELSAMAEADPPAEPQAADSGR